MAQEGGKMKTVQMYIPREDELFEGLPIELQTPIAKQNFRLCYREALNVLIETAQREDVVSPVLRIGKVDKRGPDYFWSVTCSDISRIWNGGQYNGYMENTSQWVFGGGINFRPITEINTTATMMLMGY
jgi:hypothetical protein